MRNLLKWDIELPGRGQTTQRLSFLERQSGQEGHFSLHISVAGFQWWLLAESPTYKKLEIYHLLTPEEKKKKTGLCYHWIRGVLVSPTTAVRKITKSDFIGLLLSFLLVTFLSDAEELCGRPLQGGIFSLTLYWKHSLDVKVGEPVVGDEGEEKRSESMVLSHHSRSLSQQWLSQSLCLTFRCSPLLYKICLQRSEPQEESHLWAHLSAPYCLCDEELDARVPCLPVFWLLDTPESSTCPSSALRPSVLTALPS